MVIGSGAWRSSGRACLALAAALVLSVSISTAQAGGSWIASWRFFWVPSASMAETIRPGDLIAIHRYPAGADDRIDALPDARMVEAMVRQGDVVEFRFPLDDRVRFIKRLVGLPGDRVQFKAGLLYINGVAVRRDDLGDVDYFYYDKALGRSVQLSGKRYRETFPNGATDAIVKTKEAGRGNDTDEIIVPPHSYFVVGDNRDDSNDSRYWGSVPVGSMEGKVSFLLWSTSILGWKHWFHEIN